MKKELYESFKKACIQAKELSELPELTDEQFSKIFLHFSNTDMETTIRTIGYASRMIKLEHSSVN